MKLSPASLLVALIVSSGSALAQEFPSKPIIFLVPQGPGGGTDLSVRMVEPAVSKILKQRVVIVNKPGTGTLLQLTTSPPDGYTVAVASTGNTALLPHNPGVAYDRYDYLPVIQLTNVPSVLVSPGNSPLRTVLDVVAAARKGGPGSLKMGTTALGTSSQYAAVLVERAYGIKFTYIPHKSNGEVMTAVLGGHLDLGSVDMSSAGPRIAASAVRGIGVFSDQRMADAPDLPTMLEQGVKGAMGFYNIVIVPKGTPERVITVLHDAFRKALEDPEVIEKSRAAHIPLAYLGPAASREHMERSYELMGGLVRELGLKK